MRIVVASAAQIVPRPRQSHSHGVPALGAPGCQASGQVTSPSSTNAAYRAAIGRTPRCDHAYTGIRKDAASNPPPIVDSQTECRDDNCSLADEMPGTTVPMQKNATALSIQREKPVVVTSTAGSKDVGSRASSDSAPVPVRSTLTILRSGMTITQPPTV